MKYDLEVDAQGDLIITDGVFTVATLTATEAREMGEWILENIAEAEVSRSVQRRVAAQRGEETPVFRKGKGMKAKSKAMYERYNWYPYTDPRPGAKSMKGRND